MFRSAFYWICITILIFTAREGLAQSTEREVVTQPLEWFIVNSNINLHKKFGLAFDTQFRFAGKLESAQHFVRLGFELYVNSKLSFVPIGGMYVWNFNYGEQPTLYENDEKRIWQQIIYKYSATRFHFHHRFRMEERFIQNKGTGSEDFSIDLYRMRYRFFVNIGLNKEKLEQGVWYVSVWDEFFYGWGKGDTFDKIDQNRLSVAIGHQITPKISVTAGVLYQMLVKRNGTQQENNIGPIVQLNYNFDFSKKEN